MARSTAAPPWLPGRARLLSAVLGAVVLALLIAVFWLWLASRPHPVKDHWAAVARAREYMRMRRPDRAFQIASEIRDEAPGSGEAMAIAGFALVRFGKYREARLALERALKLQPDQFEAAMTLAELNFGLGNGRRGLEVIQQAARLRPRELRVWLRMAKVQNDLGDLLKAIQAFEKALALDPGNREALTGIIGALLDCDLSDEAETWLQKALARYPDDPVLLGYAARAAFNATRLDDAVSLADRALAREPKELEALLARGRTAVARGHWQAALVDAEKAVAAQPANLGALQLLLKVESRLGLTARAAATRARRQRAADLVNEMNRLNTEITAHPEDPKFPFEMGEAARQGGSFLLASRCFEAALALDPTFRPAQESLAKLRADHPELVQPPRLGGILSGPARASSAAGEASP